MSQSEKPQQFHYLTKCMDTGEYGRFSYDKELEPGDEVVVDGIRNGQQVELTLRVLARVTTLEIDGSAAQQLEAMLADGKHHNPDDVIAALGDHARLSEPPPGLVERAMHELTNHLEHSDIKQMLLHAILESLATPHRVPFLCMNELSGDMGVMMSEDDLKPDDRVPVTNNEGGHEVVRVIGRMDLEDREEVVALLIRAIELRRHVMARDPGTPN